MTPATAFSSNQAIAARRFGGETTFIGKLGGDNYAKDALALYEKEGISTQYIFTDSTTHTGIAIILVDKDANNSIMVVPGANYRLDENDIAKCKNVFETARIVGFQLENDPKSVLCGIRAAHAAGAEVLLDPAPASPLPDAIYPCITYIKPNEIEAATLSGIPVTDYASAEQAAKWFLDKGVKHALITIGAQGAVLADADGVRTFAVPKLPSPAIDTTGAGDTFSGAFMARLSAGYAIDDAVRFAICASSLSVTRDGVVEAIPTLAEVEAML